jgi:dipeptide transport system ATP-binding protein
VTAVPLLEITNLSVDFPTSAGVMHAVDRVSLAVDEGEILGIVGESGSGKSVTMLALMGLVAFPGIVRAERLAFADQDLLGLSGSERRRLIGKDMAMIFQEPATSLNPCFTVGFQLQETLRIHEGLERQARRRRAVELLEQVGIPSPESRLRAFPHQLSGGMNQRVMIAMAIACNPRLLIADEPTTALDVTIQAQILDLLMTLQRERGMALILITHNMGVVAETAQRVAVMYAGQVVEERPAAQLFTAPQHPYTAALLAALPERSTGESRLATIPGVVPGLHDRPNGCLFNPRCPYANQHCRAVQPDLRPWLAGTVRCHYPLAAPDREAEIAGTAPRSAVSQAPSPPLSPSTRRRLRSPSPSGSAALTR